MWRRIIITLLLAVIATGSYFLNKTYELVYTGRVFQTFVAIAVVYALFKIVLEEVGQRKISESKTRYSFRKTVSLLYYVGIIVIIVSIWVEDPQALLVAYGLVGAGVAVALQDVFKNVAGGLLIFFARIYTVGDRIHIGEKDGDVMDINLFYTQLLEIKEWVKGDQATGRVVNIPNGWVLGKNVNNYTKDHQFMWDEIHIPVTYASDVAHAKKVMLAEVEKATGDVAEKAEQGLKRLEQRYYLEQRATEPVVFTELTDNWISLRVRYITDVRTRRAIHNEISSGILNRVNRTKKVKVASATFDIVGLPDVNVKQ